MADYTQSPQGGFAPHVHPEYSVPSSNAMAKLTNLTGAVVSLALVIGVGVWGYKLLVRDVSGIPVVAAAKGEMRVRPQEPGGAFAQHQGLSVNSVSALGTTDDLAEEVRLAPRPVELAEEDQPMPAMSQVAAEQAPVAQAPTEIVAQDPQIEAPAAEDIAAALESGSVESLVAQLTNGIAPMDDMEGESAPVLASIETQDLSAALSGEGMRVSLRPTLRPKRSAAAVAAVPASASSAISGIDLDAATLPAGTRLVQLGAFDSPEIARAQWGKLNARFAPFMEGKMRIVMEAKSGGRTFYRLRAQGFEDIGDARRFCSALVAESVDCIPVVTR
ncbi:SPOR domain-containing protein [uncultured Sulfitobacter sp.]|uniref:SPOR domain-containing protein n=1 Tax=uncultured Sulfitobacter sp. TaxID=191468 RepID=UPI00260E0E7F|nr:SPOR domain-containing protein [uncultured Sulfitobacter sp.]